jgi:hypothetical protein
LESTPAIFALSVKNIDAKVGIELSGNCVAVGKKIVVTTFHNIYDEIDSSSDQSIYSSQEFLFHKIRYNSEDKKNVVIRVFKFAVISQSVVKHGADGQEEYRSPILLKFVEGNYDDDWAILEVIFGQSSYCGVSVIANPSDFKFLAVCPERKLPVAGIDKLKGYHFDIALYKSSEDPEETLTCQRVEYSLVCMYKQISRVYRLQGALSLGSCGSPTINKEGEVVTIHLASLDSTAKRQVMTRFRAMKKDGDDKVKLNSTNLKALAKGTSEHFEIVYQEQGRILDEVTSIGDSYTFYKEGFVLCKSARFMELLLEMQ